MIQNLKRRLVVALSIMLVLPGLLSALPMATMEAQAAETYSMSNFLSENVEIEVGKTVNIGDYIYVYSYSGKNSYFASTSKTCTYSSSNQSVATVDASGNVKAIAKGETAVTITKSSTCKKTVNITVVDAGKFSVNVAKKNAAVALSKALPKKVTKDNAYKLLKKVIAYKKAAGETTHGYFNDENKYVTQIIIPEAGKYNIASEMLYMYANKNHPTATPSAKKIQISTAKVSAGKIKITLKKPITSEQILATKIFNMNTSSTQTISWEPVKDLKTGEDLYGEFKIKKGSKQITMVLKRYEYSQTQGKMISKTVKLQKGHKYMIGSKRKTDIGGWAKGRIVKA